MNFEKIKNKKQLILLCLTLVMFLGVSFGAVFFIYDMSQSKANILETGLISIEFTEGKAINLASIVPVIDEIGLEFDPYEFSVTNTSSIPIKMNIQFINDASSTLPIEAVRYGLMVDDKLVGKGSLSKLDEQGNFVTYENFEPGKTINCKLMLWVDYYYTSSYETFGGKIKVIGESSDAFNDPTYISLTTENYPNNTITLSSGSSKTLSLSLFNNAKQDVLYKIYYTVKNGDEEIIGTNTTDNLSGTMNTSKDMELTIVNPNINPITIQLGVKGALEGTIILEEEQKEITFDTEGPIISSISDAGEGKITFTATDTGSGVAKYCVNQQAEDTTSCTWYDAVSGTKTTDTIVTENGDYYVHVKDNAGNTSHSSVVTMSLKTSTEELIEKYGTGGLIAVNTSGTLYNGTGTIREYRYSGATANNYVFFDTDGDSVKDTNEIWRIVGMFKNSQGEWNLKLIRDTWLTSAEMPNSYTYNGTIFTIEDGTTGRAYWNSTKIGTNYNDWTTAGLQYYLNGTDGYFGILSSGAQALVDTSYTYYLGNFNYETATSISAYTDERNVSNKWGGNKATWTGKIALLYPSDYGYSASSSYWSTPILANWSSTQANTSWMYVTTDHKNYSGYGEWMLSPSSYGSYSAMFWNGSSVFYNLVDLCYDILGVRPVLNLLSTATIDINHTGTSSDPYIILE